MLKNDKKPEPEDRDEVIEASVESFPASDPPAYWASAPHPTKRVKAPTPKSEKEKS